MVLVYLSAARTCNKLENGSYVQAEIIHNEKTFIRTELMKSVTEDEAKLLMTQKLLAEIPWTTEAVTVFGETKKWDVMLKWPMRENGGKSTTMKSGVRFLSCKKDSPFLLVTEVKGFYRIT